MSQISIIKKSDIQEARRFEPEFFLPKYLEQEKLLGGQKTILLKDCLSFSNGRAYDSEEFSPIGDIYVAKIGDVTNKRDFNMWEKVSKEHFNKKNAGYLKHNDILMTLTGDPPDVGKVQLIYTPIEQKLSWNQRVARLRFKKQNSVISAEFLFTILSSKYCRDHVERFAKGIRQRNVGNDAVRDMKIPILPQSFQIQIEKIVQSAYEKQTQSKQLYKQAEEMLLKELDLLDYKPEHILSFETTKREADEAERIDAEYFQPKYGEIIKKIENYKNGWDFVENIVNWKKGVEVGSEAYQQDGMSFGRVADFSVNGIQKTSKKISKELYQELKKDYQIKQDDILFTKDGTIGLSYVAKEEFEIILSGAFLRLSIKEKYQTFEKECLSLIFNSIICKMQVEKLSGGAIIAHLKPSDFEKFKIPLIKPQIQKQIAKKIQESHKLRKESKELLETARRRVEEEIEKEAGK